MKSTKHLSKAIQNNTWHRLLLEFNKVEFEILVYSWVLSAIHFIEKLGNIEITEIMMQNGDRFFLLINCNEILSRALTFQQK